MYETLINIRIIEHAMTDCGFTLEVSDSFELEAVEKCMRQGSACIIGHTNYKNIKYYINVTYSPESIIIAFSLIFYENEENCFISHEMIDYHKIEVKDRYSFLKSHITEYKVSDAKEMWSLHYKQLN